MSGEQGGGLCWKTLSMMQNERGRPSSRYGRILSVLSVPAMVLWGGVSLAAEHNVPGDFSTIQSAIDASQPGDTVVVEPGNWRETLSLRSGIVLRGRETARTFLEGDGGTTLVSVESATGARISNFTFLNAGTAVRVSGSADIVIGGNVFYIGRDGTAVKVLDTAAVDIVNNTFYDNGVAIDRSHDGVEIRNNLFYDNGTAIIPATLTANIGYNGFLDNEENGPVGDNALLNEYFRFISVAERDFHLRFSSFGIDAGDVHDTDVIDGSRADLGAYGGSYADPTPFPVSGLSVVQDGSDSLVLKWSPNVSYLTAGYKLYYGVDEGYNGTDAAEGPSPIDVGKVTSYQLTGLAPSTSVDLDAPLLAEAAPSNRTLTLSWSAVGGASGYKVHYGTISVNEHEVDAGNSTSYRISDLQNDVSYRVAVSAYRQAAYYFAVSAYDSTVNRNESALTSGSRIKAGVGPVSDGPYSNEISAYPEALRPFPDLPDEGCFVATAAWGYYSAPQVQLLRDFRDRYLLTNGPGRWFVAWYYRHGPAAARWLDSHPAAKPGVRAALLPLIVLADLSLHGFSSHAAGAVMLGLVLVTMVVLLLRNKRNRLSGEL